MPIKINTYHGTYNRSQRNGLGKIKNIVVHYTGGNGSAKNNCIYFSTGNRSASADYFIDKDGSIWEYNNPKEGYYTWHCGDGRGRYGVTNTNSIGIEVVSAGEDFTDAQVASLKDLIAYLRSVYTGINATVRHYDASRKHCPAPYVDQSKWNSLVNRITGGAASGAVHAPAPAPAPKPAASGQAWVRELQSECNKQGFSNQKVDGIPGPKTLAGCPQLGRTSKGGITRIVQNRLNSLGYSCGKADGINGPNTQRGIKAFQSAKGLTADGIVGPKTWKALLGL